MKLVYHECLKCVVDWVGPVDPLVHPTLHGLKWLHVAGEECEYAQRNKNHANRDVHILAESPEYSVERGYADGCDLI